MSTQEQATPARAATESSRSPRSCVELSSITTIASETKAEPTAWATSPVPRRRWLASSASDRGDDHAATWLSADPESFRKANSVSGTYTSVDTIMMTA